MTSSNYPRKLTLALLLLSTVGGTAAQELPGAYVDNGASLYLSDRLLVNRPDLTTLGVANYSPPAKACVCTNLGGVSVICEDCDNETRVEYCHTHDRACQDAALKGGIREHRTFFCTTGTE